MDSGVERTIIHYYPRRALVSPLDNEAVTWDYDPSYAALKAVLADLARIDPDLRPGTRGRYDISEELILAGSIRLQLCYIGPYAALNYGVDRDLDEDEREILRRTEKVLEKHGLELLDKRALDELVPWIQHGTPERQRATVWNCLFVHPEG
jgi:hypothetical protein